MCNTSFIGKFQKCVDMLNLNVMKYTNSLKKFRVWFFDVIELKINKTVILKLKK